ncbi:nicotinate-nucleotide adenylyltransferase [Shimia sp. R10_1]|nr:nicotinate-nucleotide adenylyltransferase [Shimia sp. R10_1]
MLETVHGFVVDSLGAKRSGGGVPYGLPYVARGQRIGLLGGSFDPPHVGHVHITLEAMKRFELDQVWWLVSPRNPLKSEGPVRLGRRMAAARALMRHPRVFVSDFERLAGTRYTAQTIAKLQHVVPQAQFVWLMGADNLKQFHRWKDWKDIMERVPVGVLARPGERIEARTAKAAQVYRAARLHPRALRLLSRRPPPVWGFADVPMRAISSTELRQSGVWLKD